MYVIGARIDFACTLQTRELSTAPPVLVMVLGDLKFN